MVSLKNIITHILQAHDFEVFEKDGIIFGEKENYLVTVGLFDVVTVNDVRSYAKIVSGTGDRHIICVMEAGSAAEDEARKLGLTLWKRPDLEKEIGQHISDRISQLKDTAFTELVEFDPKQTNDTAPVFIESIGNESSPQIVKSNLNVEDVKEISKNTINGFKHELELVPHYLFQYSCEYKGKDEENIQKSGTISVNALTGKYANWEHNPELETETGHRVQLEPKIDQENAKKIAIHAIMSLNTEYKEIIVERDHATIIEKASFKPSKENITLENQAMVMLPVWCVEGKHGVMILDGITGKIISEDYYESH